MRCQSLAIKGGPKPGVLNDAGGGNNYLLPAGGNFIGTIVGSSAAMNAATN